MNVNVVKYYPSFEMITHATNGDIEALRDILKHYDCYISKASLRPFYDEYGREYIAVDQELKGLIKTALVTRILKFKVARNEEYDY